MSVRLCTVANVSQSIYFDVCSSLCNSSSRLPSTPLGTLLGGKTPSKAVKMRSRDCSSAAKHNMTHQGRPGKRTTS